MKKYLYLFMLLLTLVGCDKPEDDVMPAPSVNAEIVRFRIYQNANIFFDGIIDKASSTISVTIPAGIDKTSIRPQILVSAGATVIPASGEQQNFSQEVVYTVTSENGENVKTYMVSVNND
ncbi:MAG: DUF5018 domain-containing protein [Paenibacillus sp.]|nr:DUF5018 domain-containing protein [Paenibacillus sp.]